MGISVPLKHSHSHCLKTPPPRFFQSWKCDIISRGWTPGLGRAGLPPEVQVRGGSLPLLFQLPELRSLAPGPCLHPQGQQQSTGSHRPSCCQPPHGSPAGKLVITVRAPPGSPVPRPSAPEVASQVRGRAPKPQRAGSALGPSRLPGLRICVSARPACTLEWEKHGAMGSCPGATQAPGQRQTEGVFSQEPLQVVLGDQMSGVSPGTVTKCSPKGPWWPDAP